MKYIFVLGRSTLAQAELAAVLNRLHPNSNLELIGEIAVVQTSTELKAAELISQLGGTIKIAQVVVSISEVTSDQLASVFLNATQRIEVFGLSVYNSSQNFNHLLSDIKKELSEKGYRARYVEAKKGNSLSSVVVAKQKVTELILVFDQKKNVWQVGVTLAVQDFADWGVRDFGRPEADARSGMLPPKVARMMVNLAYSVNMQGDLTLLDPFCGVGTILAESLMIGWHVVGIDQSQKAIDSAIKNLKWLTKKYSLISEGSYSLHVGDATHASQIVGSQKIDAIVTEPFLGAPFNKVGANVFQNRKAVTDKDLDNQIRGLEKLYIGCLRDWLSLLKPEAKIVIVLPEYTVENKVYTVKKVVDMCENLGYTLELGPYTYARPQAVVKRQIYIFKKN